MEVPSLSDPIQKRTVTHLSRRLNTELGKSLSFFNGLSPEQWQVQVYTEGANWNVQQVTQHLVASERALRALIRTILEGGEGAPQDFDLNRYNESQVRKLEADLPPDMFKALSEERESTLLYLASLPEGSLGVQGRHPYFGEISVLKLFKWIYQLGQVHLREVQRALPTSSPLTR